MDTDGLKAPALHSLHTCLQLHISFYQCGEHTVAFQCLKGGHHSAIGLLVAVEQTAQYRLCPLHLRPDFSLPFFPLHDILLPLEPLLGFSRLRLESLVSLQFPQQHLRKPPETHQRSHCMYQLLSLVALTLLVSLGLSEDADAN